MAGNDVYKVIYYLLLPVYMAKLYWRIKVDGKWTWRPAIDLGKDADGFWCVIPFEEEEE